MQGMAHPSGIVSNGLMQKRGYQGARHKMSAKHIAPYVNGPSGRHTMPRDAGMDQMELTIRRMIGRRLRYRDLVTGYNLKSGVRAMPA